ncbi:MAG TPA: hypothetical protein VFC33_01555 [Acidimicrobiia bacterium]|nr:hypothetical protein [Acidimicrobiia bacterium]
MRKLAAVLCVVVVAALVTFFASPVASGSSPSQTGARNTTAVGSGTDWIPQLGGSTFIVGGTVHSNLFGRGTFLGEGTQTGPTSFTVTTVTVYKGGTLTQQGAGTDTGTNTSTVQNTITSGTGEFAGATGSSTVSSTTTQTLDPAIRTVRLVAHGTIMLASG